jgi:chitinase
VALVLGGIVFVASRAASFYAYADASQASVADGAEIVSDSSAIGGKAIQFASASIQPETGGGTTGTAYLNPYSLGLAPYNYIPWEGSLTDFKNASGVSNQVAAFIISSGGCTPAWDGDSSLGLSSSRSNTIASEISNVRNSGGDVMISLGGASGNELAYSCSNASQLKQAYISILDKYGIDKIDFDIEGSNASKTSANATRAEVVAALQQERDLKVWVTLAVETDGLTSEGLSVVKQMREKGVALSGINIMAMDYGTNTKDMGAAAVSAANSTFSQLKSIYPESSDSDIWKAIGVTAMIGINDTEPEAFTLANAKTLKDYAVQKGIGMLSYWNVARDVACSGNKAILSDSCSGVTQSKYDFANALNISSIN